MFTPWFFGQVGDQVSFQWKNPDLLLKNPDFLLRNVDFIIYSQSKLCGGGSCTLDLDNVGVMDGELELMPNGNERSMQFAALYAAPSPSPALPLGLVGTSSLTIIQNFD